MCLRSGRRMSQDSSRVQRMLMAKPRDGMSEGNSESTSGAIVKKSQQMSAGCGESMIVWLESTAKGQAGIGARETARVGARVRTSDRASERDVSVTVKLIPRYCSSAACRPRGLFKRIQKRCSRRSSTFIIADSKDLFLWLVFFSTN